MKTVSLALVAGLTLACGFLAPPADASTVFLSSLTTSNGQFTYNYQVDNTTGTIPITEVNILVTPVLGLDPVNLPALFTAPPGWLFAIATSGSMPNPTNEFGSVFQFFQDGGSSISPGSQGNFSFTTPFAPSSSTGNNFTLFGGSNLVLFGNTLAPSVTPLPDGLPLFAAGLIALTVIGWRTKRRDISALAS